MAKSDIDQFTEKRLLQTLYFQPEFLEDQLVNEDIFSSSSTRNIYKSLLFLKNSAIPFTRDALLQEYGKLDLDANPAVIDLITQKQNQSLTTIKDIITQLQDAKKRRRAAANLKAAIKKIDEVTHLNEVNVVDIKDLIGDAESSLILEDYSTKKVMGIPEWMDNYNKDLNARKKGKQYYFYNFIFDELILSGPQPGEIGIIASASGSGKSTLCLNLVNSLIDVNIPCMYFSLEMSSTTTMDRLLSKRLEIKYSDIVAPQDQGQFEDLCSLIESERLNLIQNTKFRFSEDPSMSLSDLRKYIKKFQAEIGQNYCIIVLDLLSMITDFTRMKNGMNFAQVIEVAVNQLSALSKELNIHIVGVLQLNRSSEADKKCHDLKDLQQFRPNRSQIKNAHGWVERCRYAITTFREKMYAELYLQPEQYENMIDIIECQVVKGNNFKLGKTVKGIFNGEYFTIEPLPSETTFN